MGAGYQAAPNTEILQVEEFMDKMTDAKIRSWLTKNSPEILAAYNRYQTDVLADFSLPEDGTPSNPESLRTWLENRHPHVLEKISLW